MPMSPAALEAADKAGLLKPDSTVIDRQATTARIIQFLYNQPAADLFGVETVAQSIESITADVFHSDDPELRALVSQLCSLRATGQVQHSLNGDGRMLCGRRTSVNVPLPDGAMGRHSVTQRFVSSDPEVVEQFLLNQRFGSITRQAKELNKLAVLTSKRIPELAPKLEHLRMQATLDVRNALLPENPQP